MQLFLIRHAQSENNAKPEHLRVEDPGLTGVGQQQAESLAKWARTAGLTRVISSPFLRTLLTTEKIAKATGLNPEIRIELHEVGGCYGGYLPGELAGRPGMNRSEIIGRFPSYQVADDIDGNGWWKNKPYETPEQARQRAKSLLEYTLANFSHTEEKIAYVMHADLKLIFLQQLHANPLSVPFNCSITDLTMTQTQARLDSFNQVDHLPESIRTR